MTIGQNIKRIRKKNKLTQKKLGELCGIDEANIRKYENDKQIPKLMTVIRIANALKVHYTDILKTDEHAGVTSETFGNVVKRSPGEAMLLYVRDLSFLEHCNYSKDEQRQIAKRIDNYLAEADKYEEENCKREAYLVKYAKILLLEILDHLLEPQIMILSIVILVADYISLPNDLQDIVDVLVASLCKREEDHKNTSIGTPQE